MVCEALRRMEAEEASMKRAAVRGDGLSARLSDGQTDSIRVALEKAKAMGTKGSRVYDVSPMARELSSDIGARGRRKLAREKARAGA